MALSSDRLDGIMFTNDETCAISHSMMPHDPSMLGAVTSELHGHGLSNGVVHEVAPLLTPGTLNAISSMWTPSLDAQIGVNNFASEPAGYFDTAISMGAMDAVMHHEQTMTSMTPEQSQPYDEPDHPAPSGAEDGVVVLAKKKRRARKKKVRTEEEEMRNRENFLERNRKAAQKCRQRKKVWMEDVQTKKEAASELMRILGAEVIHLVEEVTQLRAFVDEHKQCERKPPRLRIPDNEMKMQASPPNTDYETRRDSIGSNTMTAMTINDGMSVDVDDTDKSPTETQWSDFTDPCWKLAFEAQRRFAECNPNFVMPNLPLLLGRSDASSERSSPITKGEDFVSPQHASNHTDSDW